MTMGHDNLLCNHTISFLEVQLEQQELHMSGFV